MERKTKLTIILFVFLFISSGIATFIIMDNKNLKKPSFESQDETRETVKTINENNYNIKKFKPNNVFDGAKEIYINDASNSTNAVEISGIDRGFIAANFKGLSKEKVNMNYFRSEITDLDEYDFKINIPQNNISIKLYKNKDYFFVQSNSIGVKALYKSKSKNIKSFVNIIEKNYLDKQMLKILYPIPDKIYLRSKDENAIYVMNKRESKEFITKLKLVSIEDKDVTTRVSAIYPDYEVTIARGEFKYKLHLINENMLIIDTPIVYLYCEYNEKAWDFVVDKLPFENKVNSKNIKYLLNSSKIMITDMQDNYNFEDDDYYNIEIPRLLIKEGNSVIKKDMEIEEELNLCLEFNIDNTKKMIFIYENYFIYEDELYSFDNIAQRVRSLLLGSKGGD